MRRRKSLQVLVTASCGAFLAALAAVGVQYWSGGLSWWFVGICALFGFGLAGLFGDEAIDFLKDAIGRP